MFVKNSVLEIYDALLLITDMANAIAERWKGGMKRCFIFILPKRSVIHMMDFVQIS